MALTSLHYGIKRKGLERERALIFTTKSSEKIEESNGDNSVIIVVGANCLQKISAKVCMF